MLIVVSPSVFAVRSWSMNWPQYVNTGGIGEFRDGPSGPGSASAIAVPSAFSASTVAATSAGSAAGRWLPGSCAMSGKR
jgi:hypothetical protein